MPVILCQHLSLKNPTILTVVNCRLVRPTWGSAILNVLCWSLVDVSDADLVDEGSVVGA